MSRQTLVLVGVSIVSFLAVVPVSAQVTWEAGFKGGVALGKMTGDTGFADAVSDGSGNIVALTGDINDFRAGFTGGVFTTARFNPSFGLRIEALYSQKGGKGPFDVYFNSTYMGRGEASFILSYVEFPILLVGSFPATSKTKMDVFVGPTISFKSGADFKVELLGQSDQTDISSGIKGSDFGATFGLGVRVPASETVNVVFDGRYTIGLTNIIDGGGGSLKNSGLSFTGGLAFPLGGGSAGS